jgi:hypothetical protein
MIVAIIGSRWISKIAKVLGKDQERIKQMISQTARIVAESGMDIIAIPEGTQAFFMKEYKKFGGRKAIGVIPKQDKRWGYSWLESKICDKVVDSGTWTENPYYLVTHCDIVLMLSFGLGTTSELVYFKYPWKKKKPKLFAVKEFLRGRMPPELELKEMSYVSLKDLRRKLR